MDLYFHLHVKWIQSKVLNGYSNLVINIFQCYVWLHYNILYDDSHQTTTQKRKSVVSVLVKYQEIKISFMNLHWDNYGFYAWWNLGDVWQPLTLTIEHCYQLYKCDHNRLFVAKKDHLSLPILRLNKWKNLSQRKKSHTFILSASRLPFSKIWNS